VVDPRSAKIISALSALKSSFDVYAKRRDTKQVTHQTNHEDDLWCSRVRSGYTTIERKGKRFTPATAFKVDGNLFEKNLTSPETAFKHKFEDCWDVLIMDAKAGSFDGFMDSIANVILEISGHESIEAAIKGEEQNDELVQDVHSASARIQHAFQPNQQPHLPLQESTQSSLVVHRLRCCRSLFREPICIDEGSQPELWY
jgi:hypothetical protein